MTDAEREDSYDGVLVSVRGEIYAIGPKSEERVLTNGKPKPK